MIIWWGRKTRARRLETAHFDCPKCRSHQPCALIRVERVLTLYSFIPLGSGEEIARYIECDTFRTKHDAALFVAPRAGGDYVPETWECPHCHNGNPNTQYKCRRCGFVVA